MVKEQNAGASQQRNRILVVDDRKVDQLLIGHLLEGIAEITFADSGDEALEAWEETTFTAVIMDVQMSGLNGYDTVAAIRGREQRSTRPRVPIIGLSARDVDGDREAALAAGMDEYLIKPLRVDRLVAALSETLPAIAGVSRDFDLADFRSWTVSLN